MSQWADLFAALSRSGTRDTLDTSGHIVGETPTVSRSDKPPKRRNVSQSVMGADAPKTAAKPPEPPDVSRSVRSVIGADATEWLNQVTAFDPDHPPGDVPPRRWQTFLEDARRFLQDGWGDKATALGWTAAALFGCDTECPFARIDKAGLLWLVNGDRVVALTSITAVIETKTGARQTYRCS